MSDEKKTGPLSNDEEAVWRLSGDYPRLFATLDATRAQLADATESARNAQASYEAWLKRAVEAEEKLTAATERAAEQYKLFKGMQAERDHWREHAESSAVGIGLAQKRAERAEAERDEAKVDARILQGNVTHWMNAYYVEERRGVAAESERDAAQRERDEARLGLVSAVQSFETLGKALDYAERLVPLQEKHHAREYAAFARSASERAKVALASSSDPNGGEGG